MVFTLFQKQLISLEEPIPERLLHVVRIVFALGNVVVQVGGRKAGRLLATVPIVHTVKGGRFRVLRAEQRVKVGQTHVPVLHRAPAML